jgi:hypothetical protein
VKIKIKFAFPLTLTLSRKGRGNSPLAPLPQEERELTFSSPPLRGGDRGEGEYANFYYSFTINRERDA